MGCYNEKNNFFLIKMAALAGVKLQLKVFFSILGHIVEHRPSLTPNHLAKICRIVKEGPAPGTKKAEALTKKALRRWPSQHGRRFTTNSFMHGITSSTVTAALDKDN